MLRNWVKMGAKAPISMRHRGTTVFWSFSASVGRTDFASTTSTDHGAVRLSDMGVNPKIGVPKPPKMDGENIGKPY